MNCFITNIKLWSTECVYVSVPGLMELAVDHMLTPCQCWQSCGAVRTVVGHWIALDFHCFSVPHRSHRLPVIWMAVVSLPRLHQAGVVTAQFSQCTAVRKVDSFCSALVNKPINHAFKPSNRTTDLSLLQVLYCAPFQCFILGPDTHRRLCGFKHLSPVLQRLSRASLRTGCFSLSL